MSGERSGARRESARRGAVWSAPGGVEVLWAEDLPACCRREAHGFDGYAFDCPGCGATWYRALPYPDQPEGRAEGGGSGALSAG